MKANLPSLSNILSIAPFILLVSLLSWKGICPFCYQSFAASINEEQQAIRLAEAQKHSSAKTTDAQNKQNTTQSEPAEAIPDIEFEKTVHDFGGVYKGQDQTYYFKFKNVGKGVLRIEKVGST